MKAKVYSLEQLKDIFNKIAKADLTKGFIVEWKRYYKIRTNDQNALYWLWLTCLEHETGNDKNDLHDYFREEFLQVNYIYVFGKEKKVLESTKTQNTIKMKNYLDKIQAFASSELGVILPNPEDRHFEDFINQYEKYL